MLTNQEMEFILRDLWTGLDMEKFGGFTSLSYRYHTIEQLKEQYPTIDFDSEWNLIGEWRWQTYEEYGFGYLFTRVSQPGLWYFRGGYSVMAQDDSIDFIRDTYLTDIEGWLEDIPEPDSTQM